MSEPNVVQDSWTVEATASTPSDAPSIAAPSVEQLGLFLEPPSSARDGTTLATAASDGAQQQAVTELKHQQQLWDQEHAVLLAELMQAQSLIHGQVERIRNLEQALDQSQASLNELRHQMIDQQFLERQLATTEEISNIQQQAIVRLKLQLAEQQETLEQHQTNSQERDRHLNYLLETLETLAETQQTELTQLRAKISRDRAEVRLYQDSLERQLADLRALLDTQQQQIQSLEAQSLSDRARAGELEILLAQAQTQVTHLSQTASDYRAAIAQLEAELKQAQRTIEEQPTLVLEKKARHTQSARAASPPEPELVIAQAKVGELETEIARQLTAQAMLQHACQELEDERDRQQARITELEQQAVDMQEQILRQAQQASEYETAVQHWKDRHFSAQTHALKLKELLEQLFPDPPAQLSVVLADLLTSTSAVELASPALLGLDQANRPTKVDLPDFLMRRRSYKTRRS